MITATELRIGNWVDGGVNTNVYYKIKANDFVNTDFSLTRPIPLTPEILEKAGFEETYKSDYTNTFDLTANTAFGAGWNLVEGYFYVRYRAERFYEIEHLHRLQNFIHALTNTDLTLSL